MTTDGGELEVALFYDRDCPLAAQLRVEVLGCLTELGIAYRLSEHINEGRLSPTLLVNGNDVIDGQALGRGCRLERPDNDQIRAALTALSEGSP